MKFKGIILAGLMLFSGISAVSCDTPDKGYIGTNVTDMGKFDYNAALSNMTICGHSVDLSSGKYNLDSSFTLSNGRENEMEDGTNFDLYCDGDLIGTIRIGCASKEIPEGKKIYSMEILKGTKFEMNGISNASTFDNLISRFGAPSLNDRFFISYAGAKSGSISFYRVGANGTTIQSVEITF